MKRFLKNLILIAIMTLTSMNASADKYERAWKLVDQDIEQDLPESAAAKVNEIFDMAARDDVPHQILKSAVYMSQIEAMLVGDNLTSSIELFNNLLPSLRQSEYKAICHAFLAKSYLQYWKRYRSGIMSNLPQDGQSVPLENWTAFQLCDTIMAHLQLSIDKAGNAPSKWFEDFFPGGNKEGLKLRPSLVDLLLDNAVSPISGQRLSRSQCKILEDRRLYGSGSEFVEATKAIGPRNADLWQLYALNRLTERHLDSKPEIRSTIDSRRMDVLAEMLDDNTDDGWNEMDSIWVEGMVRLANDYGKKVSFASIFLNKAAAMIMDHTQEMTDEQEIRYTDVAHDLCRKAINIWPKSEGAFNCAGILSDIEQKEVSLTINSDLMAGSSNLALFEYRNVGTVYFRVVEVAGELRDMNETSVLDQLARCQVVSEWKNVMGSPNDKVSHKALTRIPPVMQGSYYIVASTGSNFSARDVISYVYCECRALTFVQKGTAKGSIEGYIINTMTGKPVPDVKYTLWQADYDGTQKKIQTYGYAGADGFLHIRKLGSGYYNLEMSHGTDIGTSVINVQYVNDMPQNSTMRLYTDRYTYYPGDSVQYAALIYYTGSFKGGAVKTDIPVKVSLINASGKQISECEQVTDSMGMALGSFRIPADAMPGRFSIRAEASVDDNRIRSSNSVNVENVSLPKYEIKFNPFEQLHYFDRETVVDGQVLSFTGQPLAGAQVQWTVEVSGYDVNVFRTRTSNGMVRIAGGQTQTGSKGQFSLAFTFPEDMVSKAYFNPFASIRVQVTDLNGETHEKVQQMEFGNEYRRIVHSLPGEGVIPDEGADCFINLDDNGRISGDVKLKVTPLSWPEGHGIDLLGEKKLLGNIFNMSPRYRHELTASAEKQNLKEYFPDYQLDFEAEMAEGTPLVDRTLGVTDENARYGFNPDCSGTYRFKLESEHAKAVVIDRNYVLKSDREWVPEGELLWAVSENNSLHVGDTAVIRLGNCWSGSVFIYSIINRFGLCQHGTMTSTGSQMKLEIPVTEDMEGGFSVNLSIMFDNVTSTETLYFSVNHDSHSLNGSINTGDNLMTPGKDENWQVSLNGPDGSPAKARILVGMYDSSLDVFGQNRWTFSPWTESYESVGYQPIRSRYSMEYNPRWYSDSKAKPYSGKVALTGVLLDPLQMAGYDRPRLVSMTKSVRMAMNDAMSPIDVDAMDESLPVPLRESTDPYREMAELNLEDSDNLRDDLNPTGLFMILDTDENGEAAISFQAPQLLTRWRVQSIAYDDSLSLSTSEFFMITRKDLSVEPAAPRFLRQGDRLEFTFKIANATDADMDVKARLDLTDPSDGKKVKAIEGGVSLAVRNVHVPANGSSMCSFIVNVPTKGVDAIEYTLSAVSGKFEDAIRQTIPVISVRTLVTKSVSLFNNGAETRSFRFEDLAKPLSGQATDESVILEYSSTPMWYAIQSIPAMIRVDNPSSISLSGSIFGAASALHIIGSYPEVRAQVEKWAAIPASEWQSRLEQNEKLTALMTGETPWYMQTQNEKDRLHALGQVLDMTNLSTELAKATDRLLEMRTQEGGWPWIAGMKADIHSTLSVLEFMGHLRESGAMEFNRPMTTAVNGALQWADSYFDKLYRSKEKPTSVGALELSYLLAVKSLGVDGGSTEARRFYTNLALKQDTRDLSLMERAQLALLFAQSNPERAEHVVQTMLERSVLEDEMGRYWRDNRSGYRWQDAPIESQALAIKALMATGHDKEAGECARWLLKQRQTGDWGTSPATTYAVDALLHVNGETIETDPDIRISLGQRSYDARKNSDLNGYMKVEIPGRASASMADIKVQSKSGNVSWGAVYYQYTDELANVEASANGLTLERTLWLVEKNDNTDRLRNVATGAGLKVGDRVRVRLKITADRAMEYVQLKDMWAAGFEPVSTRAGYNGWNRAYVAPGNSCTDIYFDRLEKGSVEIEYDMFVQKPGTFQAGRATVQCMYSPDMRSGTSAQTVVVERK